MYFGALVLILSSSMSLLSVEYLARPIGVQVDFVQVFVSFGLILGIVIIGLPYLAYTLVRRRGRLTGASG